MISAAPALLPRYSIWSQDVPASAASLIRPGARIVTASLARVSISSGGGSHQPSDPTRTRPW